MSIADDYAEIAKRMTPDSIDTATLLKEVQSHFEESDWTGHSEIIIRDCSGNILLIGKAIDSQAVRESVEAIPKGEYVSEGFIADAYITDIKAG